MIKFLYLMFFIILNLHSQDNLDSTEPVNEQNFETSILTDSLAVQDSSEVKIDLKMAVLEENINNNNLFRDFKDIDFFIYSENYHLFCPLETNFWIEKDNFSLINKSMDNLYYFRSYLPFYLYSYNHQLFSLFRNNYDSPIAFTSSFLGIGDEEMNIAYVSFNKGNILNLTDLSLSFDFFTQSGYWFSSDEKAKNFQLRLNYEKSWGRFLFSGSSIDQNIIDINQKILLNEENSFKKKGSDIELIFYNRFADIGYRTEKKEFDDNESRLKQFYISRSFNLYSHQITPKYEYIDLDDSFEKCISLIHKWDGEVNVLSNQYKYIDAKKYYLSSKIMLSKIGFEAFFNEIGKNEIVHKESGLGLSFRQNDLKSKITFGEISSLEKKYYWDFSLKYKISLNRWLFSLDSWAIFLSDHQDILPKWLTRNFIEIGFDMHHNNYIKLGLSHHFAGYYEYYQNVHNRIDLLNSFIAFEITEYFEIRLNVQNLLNKENKFIPIKNRHLVLNLKWIFIN